MFVTYSDVFRRNGTVVDAAIATLFCNGIVNSHSMGIGGGFFMTLYLKDKGGDSIDFQKPFRKSFPKPFRVYYKKGHFQFSEAY